eukprot:NODE_7557_length_758_cov_58.557480_g7310_i0.p1 GENE.NODE_7557_length_758_cov_58.557480_g7310_i0~~NODE_7557_length_758_cov_58.557480_g7310_i0.p1  ORF type:complete len:179 (+),score=14.93 NODE_7557_length_758_cov_58.557480_g7310_i0:142-678(+)
MDRSHITVSRQAIEDVVADAIVNAANETLEGGGGVDFAVHQAAGEDLVAACRKFPVKALKRSTVVDVGRCDVGEVIVTPSFGIRNCSHIFHTVAPILDSDGTPNDEHLRLCYTACLQRAHEMGLSSLAFCCLGTGFYGFPKEWAAPIAVQAASEYSQIKCIFTVVEDRDFELYSSLLT